jgi:hypothetical protein
VRNLSNNLQKQKEKIENTSCEELVQPAKQKEKIKNISCEENAYPEALKTLTKQNLANLYYTSY